AIEPSTDDENTLGSDVRERAANTTNKAAAFAKIGKSSPKKSRAPNAGLDAECMRGAEFRDPAEVLIDELLQRDASRFQFRCARPSSQSKGRLNVSVACGNVLEPIEGAEASRALVLGGQH